MFPADGDLPLHVLDWELANVPYFLPAIGAIAFDTARIERLLRERRVMPFPSAAYKGYESCASRRTFFRRIRTPYAKGRLRFCNPVRKDIISGKVQATRL